MPARVGRVELVRRAGRRCGAVRHRRGPRRHWVWPSTAGAHGFAYHARTRSRGASARGRPRRPRAHPWSRRPRPGPLGSVGTAGGRLTTCGAYVVSPTHPSTGSPPAARARLARRPTRHRGHDRPPARAPAAPVLRRAPRERSMGLRRPVAPLGTRANAPARPGTTGPRAKDDATARPRAGGERRPQHRRPSGGPRRPLRRTHRRAGLPLGLALAPGRRRPRARRHRRPARRGAAGCAAAHRRPSPDPRRSPAAPPTDDDIAANPPVATADSVTSLRPAVVLLRHHADLLRQRRAAPRPRVHDDRRRRPRPPHAPARRGRLLPHRHRRARRAGRAGGRARGRRRRASSPTATPPASRSWSPRLDVSNDFFIRTTDPEHEARGPGVHAARPRQRPHLRGHLRGLVLPALRRLQDRARARPTATRCPIHKIALEREREENWFFRLSRLPGAARAALRRAARLRAAADPLQRGALVHQGRASQDVSLLAAEADLGRAACRGTRARSSTSGSTRSSTTTRRSATRAPARTSPSASGRRPAT